ncbi:unnamed protein product [Peniophora sp. CBMAI 1063]|nr:unnamed protein product [Peniophora sp. CBMAI 1063]
MDAVVPTSLVQPVSVPTPVESRPPTESQPDNIPNLELPPLLLPLDLVRPSNDTSLFLESPRLPSHFDDGAPGFQLPPLLFPLEGQGPTYPSQGLGDWEFLNWKDDIDSTTTDLESPSLLFGPPPSPQVFLSELHSKLSIPSGVYNLSLDQSMSYSGRTAYYMVKGNAITINLSDACPLPQCRPPNDGTYEVLPLDDSANISWRRRIGLLIKGAFHLVENGPHARSNNPWVLDSFPSDFVLVRRRTCTQGADGMKKGRTDVYLYGMCCPLPGLTHRRSLLRDNFQVLCVGLRRPQNSQRTPFGSCVVAQMVARAFSARAHMRSPLLPTSWSKR